MSQLLTVTLNATKSPMQVRQLALSEKKKKSNYHFQKKKESKKATATKAQQMQKLNASNTHHMTERTHVPNLPCYNFTVSD